MKTTQNIKALIFDLDDTLWPIAPVIAEAERVLHEWMAQEVPVVVAHYSIEDLRVRRQALVAQEARFSYDLWALRHTLLSQVFDELGVDVAKADLAMQVFAHHRNRVEFYQDVLPALRHLHQRFVLASISNGFADLQAIGLDRYFRHAIAAHQAGCAKPDPRIFQMMLSQLGFKAEECLYIGDDLQLDVQGAQQVGMRAAWMNRRGLALDHAADLAIQPDLVLTSLSDLIQTPFTHHTHHAT